MEVIHFSFMEHNDIPEAARVLSIAMLDNPLHIAVFLGNGENERMQIERMFLELFQTLPGIVFIAKECNKIVGVMRMRSAVGRKIDDESVDLYDDNDIQQRKSFWLREWAKRAPQEQHWHLGPIGVLPPYRNMGVGSQLMKRFCQEVDNCAAKAYLETDSDENVRFYKKFGFKVVEESLIFKVKNRYMVRNRQHS